MTCALFSSTLLKIRVKVTGDRGTLSVFNPTGPQFGYRMTVRTGGQKRRVKVEGAKKPTYTLPARGVRGRGAPRRAGADTAGGLDREHARHRRDLRGGRPSGPGDMMETRQLGAYLVAGRVGLGLAAMVAPGSDARARRSGAARTVRARVRSVGCSGVRDAVLGAGGSIAIGQRAGGGDWLSMMALVDAFDGIVMLATPGLPKRARLIGVAAIGSAVVHLYLSRDIAAEEQPPTVSAR